MSDSQNNSEAQKESTTTTTTDQNELTGGEQQAAAVDNSQAVEVKQEESGGQQEHNVEQPKGEEQSDVGEQKPPQEGDQEKKQDGQDDASQQQQTAQNESQEHKHDADLNSDKGEMKADNHLVQVAEGVVKDILGAEDVAHLTEIVEDENEKQGEQDRIDERNKEGGDMKDSSGADKSKDVQTSTVGTSPIATASETQEVSSTTKDHQPRSARSARRPSYNSSRAYGGAGGYQNYGLAYLPYKSNFEPSEDARRRADEFFKTLKLQ